MRGVSQVVTVLLILIMAVAGISFAWLSFYGLFGKISSSSQSTLSEALSSCMKIDSVGSNKVYLRNCGDGIILDSALKVYFDDAPLNFSMTPQTIKNGETGTVNLYGLWKINIVNGENYKLKITSPATEVERYVKTVLPDSNVLDLEFDEGSGTIAYDSSLSKNDGTLYNGTQICGGNSTFNFTCPRWTNGKFGKALLLDGTNDYVSVLDSPTLDAPNEITVSAWVKLNNASNEWQGIVMRPLSSWWDWALAIGGGFNVNKTYFEVNTTTTGGLQANYFDNYKLANGQWYHVLGTYSSLTGKIDMYINGEKDTTPFSWSGMIVDSSYPVYVGRHGSYLNGTIDDVRIFNKALTPDETVSLTLGELT